MSNSAVPLLDLFLLSGCCALLFASAVPPPPRRERVKIVYVERPAPTVPPRLTL